MTVKVGEMEDNIRDGRRKRTKKEVVGCAQDVVGNKIFKFNLETASLNI